MEPAEARARTSPPSGREALEALARDRLGGARIVVVSNREPYVHVREGEEVRCLRPASGLTTALDPVMRACGGTWIAHGSGDADRETSDEKGRLRVPPDSPRYVLRRVWLEKEDEDGYYYGFSNEALWPLCHIAYTRPVFDTADWEAYRRVNERFADAVVEEIGDRPAVVLVQDYHFALVPRLVKERAPATVVCHFWHIPWPNREAFRICPWQEEILHGLLGADLLGFHIQYHCNNFLDTVDRAIEAKVDWEHFAVTRGGKTTRVRPLPISVDPAVAREWSDSEEAARMRRRLRIGDRPILLGVDRLDYTKGIPERLRAVSRMLERWPELRERFVLVQLGAPSRTHIRRYQDLEDEIDRLVEEINWRHGTGSWRPVLHLRDHHPPKTVFALYRAAQACVVTSLHDGMNLVAKEFVSAREDGRGVLVLSRFTGAARELVDAVQVNPFAVDELAQSLRLALEMPPEEQERRMRALRSVVAQRDVYHWATALLLEAVALLEARR